jgi:two-component system response regulator BaeR
MNNGRILMVEDEERLALLMGKYLEQSDFDVHCVHDGSKVLAEFHQRHYDLILLDIMLPNKDGISICTDIRKISDIPIILCTAKVDEIDRLLGLNIGADDYICKPYSPLEVVARVSAVLRRTKQPIIDTDDSPILIDEDSMTVSVNSQSIEVTALEFRLLQMMMLKPGKVITRKTFIEQAYDDNRVINDRSIDSHIKKLRKKLKAIDGVEYIKSVYGVGYKIGF